jgi:tetratricopeptide (TPR) repeat protein
MCAQALAQQGKTEHAHQELSKALKILPQSSPLYDVYSIQHALMGLDMFDEATVSEGLAELKALAANEQSKVNDMALYYLGSYYLMRGNQEEAENYWNQLKKYDAPERGRRSPWLAYAQAKLN